VEQAYTRHLDLIKEKSVEVIAESELIAKLKDSCQNKRPLKLKIGFDPTARDIHLGHTVLLHKLRKLQDLGHQVYFIIGDFTAKIGDPSGKNAIRPVLSDRQIKANALTYTKQAFKILNRRKTTVIYNSIWYRKMDLSKFLKLLSLYTVARVIERDDFSQRIKEGRPLTLLEIIYPLIQGYDSYKLGADIEFGGTDQKFNLIVGRHLQEALGQAPQSLVTMPLLVGLDGKNKMSKSLGNYIGITENPNTIVGKLMSISDEVMWEYIRLLYNGDQSQLKALHPKQAKMALAENIVSFYYNKSIASQAVREFERVFSQRQLPSDLAVYKTKDTTIDILEVLHNQGLVSSKNEARRLLAQGSLYLIDPGQPKVSTVIKEQAVILPPGGTVIKIGKKKFLKIEH